MLGIVWAIVEGADSLKRSFDGCEGEFDYLSGFKLLISASEAHHFSIMATKRVLILAIKT